MENKKILSILGVVSLFLVLGALLFLFLKPKTIFVKFDSQGGNDIASIKIKKGESVELPSITKKGSKFLGWYLNDNLVTNSTIFNENTTLTAKWVLEDVKTFVINFDSQGGSEVASVTLECNKEIKLPTPPTKNGYEFVSWIDDFETPILDGALLECQDVSLKANWKKLEEKEEKKEEKKEENKKEEKVKEVTYSCSKGTLVGTKCEIEDTIYEKCPDNAKSDGELCIVLTDYTKGERECGEKIVNMGDGSTPKVKGVKVEAGTTFCYYGEVSDDQTTCSNRQRKWSSSLNKCFIDMDQNYITTCPSDYQFYTSGDILTKFGGHNNGGCYKKVSKVKYCQDGYTLKDNDTKCIKTIDATKN